MIVTTVIGTQTLRAVHGTVAARLAEPSPILRLWFTHRVKYTRQGRHLNVVHPPKSRLNQISISSLRFDDICNLFS